MKISIITASYNYAQYIEEAINSVISQSYQDWELIIVDDGSSDNSIEIIKSYCEKDSRIKLFQHEGAQNKGLKETLLLGISHATGDWIAFLESDDSFTPDNLQKKIEIIENGKWKMENGKCHCEEKRSFDEAIQKENPKKSDVKIIFNKVNFLVENESNKLNKFRKIQKKLSKMSYPKNIFYDFYAENMILTFSCAMVEAKTLKNINFNSPVDTFLDWWLWIHLAFNNKFYYIDEELTNWRMHSKSYIKTSKKPKVQLVSAKAYWDIYQKNKSWKLLIFIVYSFGLFFFVRFFKKFINR